MSNIQTAFTRALPKRRGLDSGFDAGIDFDSPGMRLVGMARRDCKPRRRSDRGQGFAAEAERADGDEIIVGELRRSMPLHRERQIGSRQALAVVSAAAQSATAAFGRNFDAPSPGIEAFSH